MSSNTQKTNSTTNYNNTSNLSQSQDSSLAQYLQQTMDKLTQSTQNGQTATQNQQQSTTGPWQVAQPTLTGILGGANTALGNINPTGAETGAINQITANSQNLPNFGAGATNLANSFMGGDPSGLLSPALSNYNASLNPIANGELDPTKNPGMAGILDTIRNDVSNSVNGLFAGAGRDLSGKHQEYLARGLASGLAPALLSQYNTNVANRMGAAGNLYGAAGNTASAMAGNQGQGLNIAGMIPQLMNMGQQGVLAAQALLRGIPLDALKAITGLTVPIAGLGNQSNVLGTQTGQTSNVGTQIGSQTGTQLGGQVGSMTGAQQGAQQGTSHTNSQTTNTPSILQTAQGWMNLGAQALPFFI